MKRILMLFSFFIMIVISCEGKNIKNSKRNSEIIEKSLNSNKTGKLTNNSKKNSANKFDFIKRTVKLNSGYEMPILGIGVFTLTQEQAENSVYNALKEGYRLIDTAHIYANEEGVGKGIKKSGVPRKEIFVTSKLWTTDYKNAEQEIDNILKRLDLDYIDLLLLHIPADGDFEAYKAMEKAVKDGKIRSIGLSNYYKKHFDEIMEIAEIVPAVIQNEVHIYNQGDEFKEYVSQYGVIIEAWYPLGGRDRYGRGGTQTLFSNPVIVKIASNHKKTPAQILLRWQLQAGNIAIPGSSNPSHIKENIEIFDFELTKEEMSEIKALNKNERFSTFSPYRD